MSGLSTRREALLRSLWRAQNCEARWWIHPAALERPCYADVRQALDSLCFKYRLVERRARFLPSRGMQVFYYRLSPAGREALDADQQRGGNNDGT